jgi:hypothetical protein
VRGRNLVQEILKEKNVQRQRKIIKIRRTTIRRRFLEDGLELE